MQNLIIITSDNFPIAATLFSPEKSNEKTVIVSAGTGVPQHFYIKFALFLAQNGYTVLTYDFRGINKSKPKEGLKRFQASYSDWADKDTHAVVNYAVTSFKNHKLFLVGHSFGGNSIGLTAASLHFQGIITIAAQFGYWRNYKKENRLKLLFTFKVMMPILSRIMGYFPSKWVGLGESLPKRAALDWCEFMLHPDSQLAYAAKTQNYYDKITQPMLMISIDDDWMAPKKAVDALADNVYINARKERLHISPKDIQAEAIGHMDFFRSKFESNLWQIVLNWLAIF